MKVYLDAGVVISFVERRPVWGAMVTARVAQMRTNGDDLAASDLTRLECRVGPLRSGDANLLSQIEAFFDDPVLSMQPLTSAVCDRAATIRANHRFKTPDALHLAAALELGCDLFLTHDQQLAQFTDIAVEVLT